MILNVISCVIVVVFHLVAKLAGAVLTYVINVLPCRGATASKAKKIPSGARVAVIGGGIAGTSAAWSLAKSGAVREVCLIEPRALLGGNAKTYSWTVGSSGDQRQVVTGLSVLAWPTKYFRHYEMLLQKLGIATQTVTPKFFISTDGVNPAFRQGQENAQWTKDQDAWDSAVSFVRRVNNLCVATSSLISSIFAILFSTLSSVTFGLVNLTPSSSSSRCLAPSLYTIVYWNPMNVVPARLLCQRIFGVSDAFWEQVVVGIYSSSFLTARLDDVPCVILPALDDIISVGRADPLKQLHTWVNNSKEVFDKMSAEILAASSGNKVMLNTHVLSCEYDDGGKQWKVCIARGGGEHGASSDAGHRESREVSELWFDWVVFACPSTAVDSLTNLDSNRVSGFRSSLFECIVPSVQYENQRDENFITGAIHSQRAALPEAFRHELIRERYSNYIQLFGSPKDACVENTFILGTWVPSALRDATLHLRNIGGNVAVAVQSGLRKRRGDGPSTAAAAVVESPVPPVHDMYVTYNASSDERRRAIGPPKGEVDNSWAHPQLSMTSMALSMVMPLLQGRCSASYCASYTTPGNGHDLSLLSGLVVAHGLTGYYPFGNEAGVAELGDFSALSSFMEW